MLKGHGGNIYELAETLGCPVSEIIDMSSNVNPLPPLPDLLGHLKNNIHTIKALPEVDAKSITNAFAARYDIHADQVIAGNGTTQFIYSIPQVLSTKRALILGPTYSDYSDACRLHGAQYDFLLTKESTSFSPDIDIVIERSKEYDTVFVCNPNNPTSVLIDIADLHRLCRVHPEVFFVIDESYLPFVDDYVQHSMIQFDLPNVLILNSMSKIFRIPGLRIGFLISSLDIIDKFKPFLLPWTVNSLAQAAVDYLMKHKKQVDAFMKKTVKFIEIERIKMAAAFTDATRLKLFPSTTSFMLGKLYNNMTAEGVCAALAQERILIRNCSNFAGLSNKFIRISLKTSEINRMLEQKLLDLVL
ncbi:MAG: aminotransferase class I/II-fold pyridoxal phosphate-dependent enzyme [Desulfobacteraceae bacterium]|nr:aminotransferase class I/II-fold pyridoxal phosphate-dependent enzyme [Desulfobacteraceae bacterium]MDH3721890.1 aminotransferase class I/II-fold pyridoxal phosphate-dependent enzyme [Desulfobacteraceae bacterium]MDH3875014.1 aminotransferase class I/II-fold pyridoxal phosphate-dependent enzyme [Desulfobacteraceae bacterium]MDH3957830.1 aminotransferase class I/II-fold pyridoxal phosphate-dependent enzyme [Desulfobacteraceae bacterium]